MKIIIGTFTASVCAADGLRISGSEMSDKVYRFRLDRQAALE